MAEACGSVTVWEKSPQAEKLPGRGPGVGAVGLLRGRKTRVSGEW